MLPGRKLIFQAQLGFGCPSDDHQLLIEFILLAGTRAIEAQQAAKPAHNTLPLVRTYSLCYTLGQLYQ
jgi:hypothetical protein